jgi:uncharacterized protein (AIM24 family)
MAALDPMMDQKSTLFQTQTAPLPPNMKIVGTENQILQLMLPPGEEIIAEPGSLMCADDRVEADVNMGTCADRCFRECCAGESGVRIHWNNTGQVPAQITLAPKQGKVVPINLDEHGGEMMTSAGAFMATTDPDMEFDIVATENRAKKAAVGGSFWYLKMLGQGFVFLNSSGAIFQRVLKSGETIVVDRSHILAWDVSVKRGSRRVGGMDMMFCGGEGITNATFTGPGAVIMNSSPPVFSGNQGQA